MIAGVVRVRPDITAVDRAFDYAVPEKWEQDGRASRLRVGSMVRVSFGGRRVAGWVVETGVEPEPGRELSPLQKLSGVGPPADLIDLASWASWRWAGRVPHFLRAASPPRMVESVRLAPIPQRFEYEEARTEAFTAPMTLVQVTPRDDGLNLALAAAELGRALILVPTIRQRTTLARFLRQYGYVVAEHDDQWELSAAGSVTVGTRLGAWAPMPKLDAVLVLDEHDHAYKEERTPSWNGRDVAVERAVRAGCPCVLASPSPSLESLERMPRRLVPERSVERNSWPSVDVVDLRKTDRPGLLTEDLVPLVRGEGPVACIINRKGRARMLACASCDSLATCESCGAAVGQPEDDLVCASCGTTRPVVCLVCGATKMKLIRPGISRLSEDLAALARTDVVEVTAETPHRDLADARLLIGTEALLRRISKVRVVVFLDFDQELAAPRSRASEDAFALLTLAARRIVMSTIGGRIVIQTRRPDDVVVEAAVRRSSDWVARAQRDTRKVLGQPPYGAWAVVSGAGASEFVDRLGINGGLQIARLDDRWRIAADGHETLLDALAATERPKERVRVEIDPLDL